MSKISNEKALADWQNGILRGYLPFPGKAPEEPVKMYKDNPHNEWLTTAVAKLGGHKKVGKAIKRNPSYIYNVMRGYYPMSKELQSLIQKEVDKLNE